MRLFPSDCLNSKNLSCHRGSLDAVLDFCEGRLPRGGRVVSERREAAVIGCSQRLHGNKFCCFEHAISYRLRTFDFSINGVRDPYEEHLTGFKQGSDGAEHAPAIGLAGHLNIEAADLQVEQWGQQIRVVHIGAMRGVMVSPGAGMHSDPLTLNIRKSVEHEVI